MGAGTVIILLDTSQPLVHLELVDDDKRLSFEWQADRQLARGLLGWIVDELEAQGKGLQDVTGIGVRRGPGSFTGLRIGLTIVNTMADARVIPIVGDASDEWADVCLRRLGGGENDKIVLPLYDREANITKPRK